MPRRARTSILARRYPIGGAALDVLLFPREDWTVEEAQLWAKAHGFKWKDYEIAENHIRIFQSRARVKAGRARVIRFAAGGIKAAMAWR